MGVSGPVCPVDTSHTLIKTLRPSKKGQNELFLPFSPQNETFSFLGAERQDGNPGRSRNKPRPHLCRPAMPDFGSGLHTLVTTTASDSPLPRFDPAGSGLGAQGSGPGAGGDGAAPISPFLPPAPAGPSGVPSWPGNLEEGSRERLAGVGNKAPRSARRRSVPHPAPGRPPSPRLRQLGGLRLPRRQPPHRAPLSREGVVSLPKRNSLPGPRSQQLPAVSDQTLGSGRENSVATRNSSSRARRERGPGESAGASPRRDLAPAASLSATPGCLARPSRPKPPPRCPLLPAGLPRFQCPVPAARRDSPPSSGNSRTLSRGSRRRLLGVPGAAAIAAGSGRGAGRRTAGVRTALRGGPGRPSAPERGRRCSSRSRSPSPRRPEPEPRAAGTSEPSRAAAAGVAAAAAARPRPATPPPRRPPSGAPPPRRPLPVVAGRSSQEGEGSGDG